MNPNCHPFYSHSGKFGPQGPLLAIIGTIISTLRAAGLLAVQLTTASAAVFSTDTLIGHNDAWFEGQDIVITNCTVTIDGSHVFSTLRIETGGILTHTSATNGFLTLITPTANEPQVLTGTNLVTLGNTNVFAGSVVVKDASGSVTFALGADYILTQPGDGSTKLNRTTASAIPDGATVLVFYEVRTSLQTGCNLTVSGNVQVLAGAAIRADGCGYGSNLGSGSGGLLGVPMSGGGGGHGGYGGLSSSNAVGGVAYGSAENPTTLGSGGGASGVAPSNSSAGGGAIRLETSGSFLLEGVISANGSSGVASRSGGGAGGSIWIRAGTLSGGGVLAANGGNGEPVHGGGGGGGRIAIEAATNFLPEQSRRGAAMAGKQAGLERFFARRARSASC